MLKCICNRKHARCLPCLIVRFLAVSVIRIKIKGANMKNKAKVFTLALLVVALFTALMLSACVKTDDKTPDGGVKTYTVTFVTDGGTAVPSQTISEGGKVVKPADPKKTATVSGKAVEYEFTGWYSGETKWDFETMTVGKDLVLTAGWKLVENEVVNNHTVTFVTDGGTAVPPQTISEGGKVVKPADPKKTAIVSGKVIDYEFEGWFSGEAMWDFETMTISADAVLTAKWKQDYTPPYLPKN